LEHLYPLRLWTRIFVLERGEKKRIKHVSSATVFAVFQGYPPNLASYIALRYNNAGVREAYMAFGRKRGNTIREVSGWTRSPFYSSQMWREARRQQLKRFPFCLVCAAIGIREKATEVDHIVSMNDGGSPYDPSNLRALCKQHHSQKTAQVERGKREERTITGIDGWPIR
jgi:5-methylcytosine-specific restriction protein A